MPPKKSLIARRNNANKARQCTQKYLNKIIIRFVLSTIASGLTFSKICQFKKMNHEDIPISNPDKFYKIQKIISPLIESAAKRNIIKYQNKIEEGTVISFDGSWDHKRNGKFCIVEAFDTKQKKIIDYEIVSKKTLKNPEGDFTGPSNQMEIECVKRIVQRLKTNSKIIGYVHDQDAKLTNYMKDNWNIIEYIDPNHTNKSFCNRFESYKKGTVKNVKKGLLNGVQKSLSKFRQVLVKSKISVEQKKSLWLNAEEHYKGNHTLCLHEKYKNKEEEFNSLPKWSRDLNEEKLKALRIFLNDTLKYVKNINTNYNTQLNEGFHFLKTEIAPKTISWVKSYHARMAIAVLRFNEPDLYFEILETALQLGTAIGSQYLTFYYGIRWIKIKRMKSNSQKKRSQKNKTLQRIEQEKSDKSPNSGYDFSHGKK